MFSSTTIAASSTMPVANARPAREMTFNDRPAAVSTTKVASSDTGMARAMIIVARHCRRNSHRAPIAPSMGVIHDVVGDRPAYLTFDIDCLDPAFAPGTGTPVAGGLSTAQALDLVRGLGDIRIVGADVVEVAPPYDVSEVTALAAATIAHDLLCLEALRRGANGVAYGRR